MTASILGSVFSSSCISWSLTFLLQSVVIETVVSHNVAPFRWFELMLMSYIFVSKKIQKGFTAQCCDWLITSMYSKSHVKRVYSCVSCGIAKQLILCFYFSNYAVIIFKTVKTINQNWKRKGEKPQFIEVTVVVTVVITSDISVG